MTEISIVKPRISVIIPVKNEAAKIAKCIDSILKQSVPVFEILALDSGSDDGSLDIMQNYDLVKVIPIPPDEFNHGQTRNLGVEVSSGDYCLLTVGDAEAYDEKWIENLMAGFTDEEVVAVCGQQVVAHLNENNPVEWFRPVSEPRIRSFQFDKSHFNSLSPEEKKKVCSWDDVTAIYKRDVLLEIPFRRTSYAEDAQWAKDAILKGKKIAYNPAARVYHYHLADPEFAFKKSFTVFYHLYQFFGLMPKREEMSVMKKARILKLLWISKGISLAEMMSWYSYNISLNKGVNRAVETFLTLLKSGEEALNKYHEKEFSKPPVPVKSHMKEVKSGRS
ncbi:MAG: glycosyltransferase [Vicingaceae bacterium]